MKSKPLLGPARAALIVLGVAGVLFHGAAQTSPLADEAIRQILSDRVGEQADRIGIVAGIVTREGRRVIPHGSTGGADPVPVDGDTVFEIGSITKVFTALLLADMETRGEVDRAAPISSVLPASVRVPERDGQLITFMDLANHRSGLPRVPANMGTVDLANPYATYSVEQLYEFLSGYELTRDIGARYEYSNLGAGLLGHALSLAAGQDYESLVRERISAPLGMTSTSIALSADMRSRLAQGHDDRFRATPLWDLPTLAGAGALRSTVNDLLSFLAMHLGYVDSPLKAAADSLLTTRWSTTGQAEVGLGWHVLPHDSGPIITHDGGTGGYRASAAYDPLAGVGVAVLSNAGGAAGVTDIALHLLDPNVPLLPPDSPLQPPRERTEITLDAEILETYVGRYELTPGVLITITRTDSQLYAQLTGQPAFEVYPASETAFFLRVVDAQVIFHTDTQGRVNRLELQQLGTQQLAHRLDTDADPSDEWFGRRIAADVDPRVYDRYVGRYRLGPGVVFDVTREGDRLLVQLTGQPRSEIFPESETRYFYKNVDALLVFDDPEGTQSAALTLHQSGRELRAVRTD